MKTKLYSLLTGLLMAACVTSSAQEIVNGFSFPSIIYRNDIMTTSDGSIIIGSFSNNYDDYMVYKLSPEGTLIDSIALHDAAHGYTMLLEIPSMPDHYIFVGATTHPYYASLRFILIDANFTVTSDVNTDFQTAQSYGGFTYYFVTPDSYIGTVYSKDEGNGSVGHYAFFTLDGTLLKDIPTAGIPTHIGFDVPASDTLLQNSILSVFSETPFTYSRLGHYTLNGTIHIVNYIMDCDFNLVNRIEYAPIAPETPFSSTTARVYPFNQDGNSIHLLLAYTSSNKPTLIKYDNEGHPLAYYRPADATSLDATLYDENTIYISYGKNQFGESQHLIRLNGNLDKVWEITLPCPNYHKHQIRSLEVLPNGDIAAGVSLYNSNSSPVVQVFIIRDNDPTITSETIIVENPFSLYPNPVKEQLTLRFDDGEEPESVELYDLAGRLVAPKFDNIGSIDMSAMSSGVYILRVTMKDGTRYHERIAKE